MRNLIHTSTYVCVFECNVPILGRLSKSRVDSRRGAEKLVAKGGLYRVMPTDCLDGKFAYNQIETKKKH